MYGYPMQSNEVKSSYHMEKEGLVRAIDLLKKKRFRIGVLVKSPPPLSGTFEQPLKEEAIMKHQTRFAQQ